MNDQRKNLIAFVDFDKTMLDFNKQTETASFYDPSEEEVKDIEIEIREDPLTGKTSRLLDKPIPSPEKPDMSDVEKKGFCPFCPETIDQVGARDTKVLSGKKLEQNEAVLLANVTPYSKHSLVIRLTEEHYLPLDEFREEHFLDGFKLVLAYLKKMDLESELSPALIMNYLKPAGSSIIHPHMQMLVSNRSMDYQRRIIESAERFYKEKDENYWDTLLKEEKNGERWVGETGGLNWVTAYAPRGFEHVKGITLKHFIEFDDQMLRDLSQGIVKVLKGYNDLDRNSFNFSIFIPPLNVKERFATVIDMITRSNLDRFYRADDFAMPKLMDEPYCNRKPEELAEKMKSRF